MLLLEIKDSEIDRRQSKAFAIKKFRIKGGMDRWKYFLRSMSHLTQVLIPASRTARKNIWSSKPYKIEDW